MYVLSGVGVRERCNNDTSVYILEPIDGQIEVTRHVILDCL